jgi:large subunit ribosomal protein L13
LVVDAEGMVLGRMATEVATRLRGKHKAIFAPHIDTGDFVVVINASKIVMTADKGADKFAYHHSGYPGGLTKRSYAELLQDNPEELVRRAVRGMLPRNKLARQQINKLKVYAGPEHPHEAQQPKTLDLPGARRAGRSA